MSATLPNCVSIQTWCGCGSSQVSPSNAPVIAPAEIIPFNGSPVGAVFPNVASAIGIQMDSNPPNLLWLYFNGQWH